MVPPPYDQSLDTALRQIRLLQILPQPHPNDGRLQCHLTIESLLQDPEDLPYQALSYTWGKPDDFNFKIWVNGVLVPVRQNLMCALRVLRADEEAIRLPIWIDALCIDQQNIAERGHQVDMMGVIYQSARHVIAWLGTPDSQELESRELDIRQKHPRELPVAAFDFAARVAKSNTSRLVGNKPGVSNWAQEFIFSSSADEGPLSKLVRKRLPNPIAAKGVGDLIDLCSNEYWKRLWVVQEACLAHRLLLFRGRVSMEWSVFSEFREAVEYFIHWSSQSDVWPSQSSKQSLSSMLPISPRIDAIRRSRPWQLEKFMRSDVKISREELMSIGLESALTLSRDCLCEDKRDKFYGILGLTTDVDEFDVPVDSSLSLFQVYVNVLQNRLEDFGTDSEDSVSSNDSEDGLTIFYPAGAILSLSRTLQKFLLGPDFGMSSFEEMRSGRAAMLRNSTADYRYLNVRGYGVGKVIGCSTTLIDLRQMSTTELV